MKKAIGLLFFNIVALAMIVAALTLIIGSTVVTFIHFGPLVGAVVCVFWAAVAFTLDELETL